jgi:DNA-binding NarL/FixJ family response regulator
MIHQRRTDNRIPAPLVETLTPREKEVLQLLVLGLNNKQISAILHIHWRTVQAHLSNIYAKLGANNRTHAAMLAIAHEIVSKN